MSTTIATVFATLDTTKPSAEALLRAKSQLAFVKEQVETSPAAPDVYDVNAPHVVAARLAARAGASATTDDALLTAAIVAAATATAVHVNATDDDVLKAVVAGHDVATRVLHTLTGHTDYDAVYAAAVLGAVTAVNTLTNRDLAARLHAYGIASTQAARLANQATDTPAARAKDAADTAVEAGLLAAHGFTGPTTGIDGRRGVITVIAEKAPVARLNDTGGILAGVSYDIDPAGPDVSAEDVVAALG